MSGQTRAGSLIFVKDLERMSAFYAQVLDMRLIDSEPDHHVLESADFQLLVHAVPTHIAHGIEITSPPQRRESAPIKLFFTVASIAQSRATAAKLGGEVFAQQWQWGPLLICDAFDPEGNIFQVREL